MVSILIQQFFDTPLMVCQSRPLVPVSGRVLNGRGRHCDKKDTTAEAGCLVGQDLHQNLLLVKSGLTKTQDSG